MRVAVVGAGITGLAAAYTLAKAGAEVVVYEKEGYLGGHAKTVSFDGILLDLGFMVFNRVTYPNVMELFESLGVETEVSDMSFAVSLDDGKGYEWGSRNGFSSLFSQKANLLNPYFWGMIQEILKFKGDALKYLEKLEGNPDVERNETLEHYIKSHGYSELFQKGHLIPICATFWSCHPNAVLHFPAYHVLSFFRNSHLLQLSGGPQWHTVKSRSQSYIGRIRDKLERRSCTIRTGYAVQSVFSTDVGCCVVGADCLKEMYDRCIISTHAPDSLKLLGEQATFEEARILGAFQYVYSDIYLHRDKSLMPKNPAAWSACNYLGATHDGVCVTYWLNVLQNLGSTKLPFLVTLNPPRVPKHTLLKWCTSHSFPSVASSKAALELEAIQGQRAIWFSGAYQGYGSHEDGLKAGTISANSVLGKDSILLRNPIHMVPSLMERGARHFVIRFLESYISTGYLTLLEEGGNIYEFKGTRKQNTKKAILRVHNPLFYWKIATEADLGLADAYINGYFSFVDKEKGLLDLLLILIANRELRNYFGRNFRGWWTSMFATARFASARYFFKHMRRQTTIKQAIQNISNHDLSNYFFSLILDETMSYSCAIFKTLNEDLKTAQLHKISLLIKKAQIDGTHEVLEIGCGWGGFAIEVVKQTGCRYTGITLSVKQLEFAKKRAKDEGLEFSSLPDQRYDEYRRSSEFLKEYIFPGLCVPSLSRITTAMMTSSKFCIEHVENIGNQYYQTLASWRSNLLANKDKIIAMEFDEKFMRTWEYYFIYCAAGFQSCTFELYQIVLSRPGNVGAFGDPFKFKLAHHYV